MSVTSLEFAPVSPSASASAGRTAGAGVRLTRRGRLLITLMVVALLALAMVSTAARSEATAEPGAGQPTRTVVVESGDTLWGIAGEVASPGTTQAMVYEIQRLNSLPTVSLAAGQRIEVPLG